MHVRQLLFEAHRLRLATRSVPHEVNDIARLSKLKWSYCEYWDVCTT
jgi:hypothetical protein